RRPVDLAVPRRGHPGGGARGQPDQPRPAARKAPLMSLLTFTDVDIWYRRRGAPPTRAVAGLSLTVAAGALVTAGGEAGSGKSTAIRAAIGLLPATATVRGQLRLAGTNVAGWSHNRFARLRGSYAGYVPQDPGVSLNPVKTVGRQLEDALRTRLRRHRLLP